MYISEKAVKKIFIANIYIIFCTNNKIDKISFNKTDKNKLYS